MDDLTKQQIARAKEVLARAELVNAGQYTHGINSSKANLKWYLKEFEAIPEDEQKSKRFAYKTQIYDYTLKLAGYLYNLQNNLSFIYDHRTRIHRAKKANPI